MLQELDALRLLSIILATATFSMIVRFWKKYPQFHPQFFLILSYLVHGVIYYCILLIDKVTPTTYLANSAYDNWGAVLRFHSFVTWFFIAILYFRYRR